MKKLISLCLGLFCCIATQSISAAALEVFDLNSRTAEEIIPIIQPLVNKNTSLSGQGYQLFVRGEKSDIKLIKGLLQRIDSPLRNLRVSVRQISKSQAKQDEIDFMVNIESGKLALAINPSNNGTQLRIKRFGTKKSRENTHSVRVMEGHKAYIYSGINKPVKTQETFVKGKTSAYQYSAQYKQVNSGFYALPRVVNDRVTIEINPQQQSFRNGNVISTHDISTVIKGRVGQWITLGGLDKSSDVREKGIASRTFGTQRDETVTQVKVEIIE